MEHLRRFQDEHLITSTKVANMAPDWSHFGAQVGLKIDAKWVPRCTYQAIAILLYCYIAILLYCYIAVLVYCYIAILLYCYIAGGPFCIVNNGVRSTWVDFKPDSLDPPGPPSWGPKWTKNRPKIDPNRNIFFN